MLQRVAMGRRGLLLLLFALTGCRSASDPPQGVTHTVPEGLSRPPPAPSSEHAQPFVRRLEPLAGPWLERLSDGERPVIVMPPIGAVTPRRLVVGVHGADDRPEWACGGWRLAARAAAFVVCPQGGRLTTDTFAWASEQQLAERVDTGLKVTRAHYEPYLEAAPLIYAGFSQGATLAEPFLRKNAARFPIVILAEGGYATARNAAFARAFYAAGGRRVVLVCGGAACFQSARNARPILEKASLQVLIVGDEKAGHNLNARMQLALQAAWPDIVAPLVP